MGNEGEVYGEGILRVSDVLDLIPMAEALENWIALRGPIFRESRDFAAEVGTYAHEAIERVCRAVIDDNEASIAEVIANAVRCPPKHTREVINSFNSWLKLFGNRVDWHPILAEDTLHHPTLPFAGTKDNYCRFDFEDFAAILDWKTSKRTYYRHKVQLAAYLELHEANYGDSYPVDRLGIVILDKTGGEVAQIKWYTPEEVQGEREWFLSAVHPRKLLRDLGEQWK